VPLTHLLLGLPLVPRGPMACREPVRSFRAARKWRSLSTPLERWGLLSIGGQSADAHAATLAIFQMRSPSTTSVSDEVDCPCRFRLVFVSLGGPLPQRPPLGEPTTARGLGLLSATEPRPLQQMVAELAIAAVVEPGLGWNRASLPRIHRPNTARPARSRKGPEDIAHPNRPADAHHLIPMRRVIQGLVRECMLSPLTLTTSPSPERGPEPEGGWHRACTGQ